MIVPSPASLLLAASANTIGAGDVDAPGMAALLLGLPPPPPPATATTIAVDASPHTPFGLALSLADYYSSSSSSISSVPVPVPANAPHHHQQIIGDPARWVAETAARASELVAAALTTAADDPERNLNVNLSANVNVNANIDTTAALSLLDHPGTVLSTIALVTASDMIPFVPCQPLAISLGARYGPSAFPICVLGQTLAGVLAFSSSRRLSGSNPDRLRAAWESLGTDGSSRFREFRASVLGESDDDDEDDDEPAPSQRQRQSQYQNGSAATRSEEQPADEATVFLALVGLRLAPFFPFSAGNYLLGGATSVGLRPFVLATLLGCTVSNAASILVGMGGAELLLWRQ